MTTRASQIECLLAPLHDYRDNSIASGYTVYFYSAGTSTAKNVWTEKEKTNPYTSATIGSNGIVHLYGDGVYKIVVKDTDGTTVYEWDNVKVESPNVAVLEKSGTYTATVDDDYIIVNTAGGNVTINLYAAASFTHPLCIKNIGSNSVILDPSGSELIEGATTYTLSTQDAAVWLFSNLSAWYVANDISASAVTLESGATVNAFANTGVHIFDTNASHDLIIKPGSDLTADRNFTITTGDAARTITLGRDIDTENQTVGVTITVPNEGLHVLDTNASHDLVIKPGSDLSADRILTLTTGDAARTITLGRDIDTENQVVGTTITIPNEGLHVLDTNASHDLIIKPGSDLSADRILTLTTGDAARTLTLTGNATLNQDVSTAGSPDFTSLTVASDKVAKFKLGTYTGDGSTSYAITGVGFAPRAVFVMEHPVSGTANVFLKLDLTWTDLTINLVDGAVGTDRVIALGADGFTVDDGGSDAAPNKNGVVYDYIAFGDS